MDRQTVRDGGSGIGYKTEFPSIVRSSIHKVSLIWVSKLELNEDTIGQTGYGKGQALAYRKNNHRLLRKAERGRSHLPQERAHQLCIQHQLVSPENTYTSNDIWPEQVIFRNIHTYTYMLYQQLMKKDVTHLKDRRGVFGRF